jgi:hypothetical protein
VLDKQYIVGLRDKRNQWAMLLNWLNIRNALTLLT